jgi:UDP-N-acetylmuramoyl-L-alanyl-D-glutamate--2,6-diaminopimelate ligase
VLSLGELAGATPGGRLVAGDPGIVATGLTHDSRAVIAGAVFVALPGRRFDGAAFVSDAVRRGAAAVVAESERPAADVGWIAVPRARAALADLAAAWHGFPSERLRLVGVTGTDGKTTTTRIIAALLEAHGRHCDWFTTADVKIGDAVTPNAEHHTTPEADRVQAILATMVSAGADCATMEASSHALHQDRLRACAFDVAVFTNLSPEHLDYHGSLDAYLAAKARLFAALGEPSRKDGPRYAVLNADDPASARLREACPAPVFTYALDAAADVRARAVRESAGGLSLTVQTVEGEWPLETRFLGRHNASNWLAAVSVALREGVRVATVQQVGRTLRPPPGRLELVDCGQPFRVYVDFAHTPQALRAVVAALRAAGPRRLLLAFGLAGGRMAANRPVMGELAADLADYFVITSDDAYPEDPSVIAAEIEAGVRAAGLTRGDRYTICLDRRQAIRELLRRAQPGDIVLLAGMGHEQSLHVDERPEPWSDPGVAREELATLGYTDDEN